MRSQGISSSKPGIAQSSIFPHIAVGVAIGLLTLVLPARQHYNNPGLSPVFDGPASDDEALWPILVRCAIIFADIARLGSRHLAPRSPHLAPRHRSVASAAGAALRRFFLIRVLVSLLQFFLYIPLSLACLLTRAALRLVMWVVRPALHLALGWARALPLARQTQWIWVLLIICSIMVRSCWVPCNATVTMTVIQLTARCHTGATPRLPAPPFSQIAVRMRAPDPPRPRTKRTLPFPTRCPKGRWFR